MSEPKHTPGPWRWEENTASKAGCRCVRIVPDGGNCETAYLQSFPSHGRSDDEAMANAHLIAAAPDMLIALEAEVYWRTDKQRLAAAELRHKAIAKAKGEAQ